MSAIIKLIHSFENKFDSHARQFTIHHPILALIAMFVIMPIFILITVAACTTAIAFPMAWLFGWL